MTQDPAAITQADRPGPEAPPAPPRDPEPSTPRFTNAEPLNAGARARIGRTLRLHYAAVLDQPIPEHLRALLDDLAARSDPEAPR